MHIGLISDTHGFLDPKVFKYFKDVDEIWHAGDFGNIKIANQLSEFKTLKGVYGNIDGTDIRKEFPLDQKFNCDGIKVWMRHIGGYPGNYDKRVRDILNNETIPQLFICGHSHILKVMYDKKYKMMCFNPGAAGIYGIHKIKTIMRFHISNGKVKNPEVIQLGYRGKNQI